ncbi:protein of unknown function [Azospirillum baldaniorum]|uniref:Uncharacterized protein n=1 Tax=Azospirillum baldaniorum TaxID=1064539 RepID=A0A9P1JSY4_9PROT|nr:protein of unknown function [Azospirillum baldaniorum]
MAHFAVPLRCNNVAPPVAASVPPPHRTPRRPSSTTGGNVVPSRSYDGPRSHPMTYVKRLEDGNCLLPSTANRSRSIVSLSRRSMARPCVRRRRIDGSLGFS